MTRKIAKRSVTAPLALLGAALISGPVPANPTGAVVVNGQVSIDISANTLTVINSPNSIINWQGFSIGANEVTRFLQQSAASAVLNRVVGASPSAILGALQSNGRVFLVNPNGIVFGAAAQIEVGGLVASTLNISDADFLAGRMHFSGAPEAGIVSAGRITAENGVYLLAPNITVSGFIHSQQGSIVLGAGQTGDVTESSVGNASSVVATGGFPGAYFVVMNGNPGNITAPSIHVAVPVTSPVSTAPISVGADPGQGSASAYLAVTNAGINVAASNTASANSSITLTGGTLSINSGGGTLTTGSARQARNTPLSITSSDIRAGATGGLSAANVGLTQVGQTQHFVFGDASGLKVVETRDAAGNVAGWSIAAQ